MADLEFKPYVPDGTRMAEFTPKAVIVGVIFGFLFGAANAYLALRAGLTVSASIPIAVLAISLLKKFGGSTILENNIVQTVGSAGESVATGAVFTLPGFLFLSVGANGASYFSYWVIFTLALLGGILGTLMMIPLRPALIVKEHGSLPFPEGTACAAVLVAGEKGGNLAKTAYMGLGIGTVYALIRSLFAMFSETPTWFTSAKSKIFPGAVVRGEAAPEYLGVGYILGIKYSALLMAGGVLGALALAPLLASVVPFDTIYGQLVKVGCQGKGGWNPATHEFARIHDAIHFAYIRQIGAGMVAAGGFITLFKTIPTIVSAFKGALGSLKGGADQAAKKRTENDLPLSVVILGSLGLIAVIAVLPFIPGQGFLSKILLGLLMVVFGFFFVTVSSRIVGIIGSSSNPISGMTIAGLMSTCLIFLGLGWTGDAYQPMALCVAGIVCVAASNAGATSQDLKTGYLVGSTPRYQQIGLLIGALAAAIVVGLTLKVLDNAHVDPLTNTVVHAIGGDKLPAPQGTLMATLIKGMLAHNLDWQFVIVGILIAVTLELCQVRALAFAVGLYLGMATTLPIFLGGAVAWLAEKKNGFPEEEGMGPGQLFSTGLVAAGALTSVVVSILQNSPAFSGFIKAVSLEHGISSAVGNGIFNLMGLVAFCILGAILFRMGTRNGGKVEM